MTDEMEILGGEMEMEMERETLIERWESRSGKHWAEFRHDSHGFFYCASDGGGSFGNMRGTDALARFHNMLAAGLFQPDANVTPMHRTYTEGW